MKQSGIALTLFGLVFVAHPLSGQEHSYSATKEAVWNAVHQALAALEVAVSKEDSAKGEIQSDSAPTDSTYLQCELHVGRGHPPDSFFFLPKARLQVSLKVRSPSETSVGIKYSGKKIDVSSGGFIGQMVCKSTGKLEEAFHAQVQSRLAAPSGRP